MNVKEIINFDNEVTLFGNTGIQFMDFSLSLDSGKAVSMSFIEQEGDKDETNQDVEIILDELTRNENGDYVNSKSGELEDSEKIYNVQLNSALEVFEGCWLPAPIHKRQGIITKGEKRYEKGPTLWSRMMVVKMEKPDEKGNHFRLIIAFDTKVLEKRGENRPYTNIELRDIQSESNFDFLSSFSDISWFLYEKWVRAWLTEIYSENRKARDLKFTKLQDGSIAQSAFWSLYLVLIKGVIEKCEIPSIKLINTFSTPRTNPPIDVNIVLDIGNNRTCGVLIEEGHQTYLDLTESKPLELRDLTQPQFCYNQPFNSFVEFAEIEFGSSIHARRGGAINTFFWPSPLRVGQEAKNLIAGSKGVGGYTGISAPKRYLWDEDETIQQWYFNQGKNDIAESKIVVGKIMSRLTSSGDLLTRILNDKNKDNASPAIQANFSRSSMLSLMIMEIFCQAFRQMNDPSYRQATLNSRVPREAKRLILTLPSATPIVEKNIFEKRAKDALDLLWELMDWVDVKAESNCNYIPKPELIISYDEASSTQLVYLYAEIIKKFKSTPFDYFKFKNNEITVKNKERLNLRIASLDIGGGTTDLMISTYSVNQNPGSIIELKQNFREGFRSAGDDIVHNVISDQIFVQIAKNLAEKNKMQINETKQVLRGLFSDDGGVNWTAQKRHQRRLFTNQVLMPMAYKLLNAYENLDGKTSMETHFEFSTLFKNELPSQEIINFFDEEVKSSIDECSIRDMKFNVNFDSFNDSIRDVIGKNLEVLSKIIKKYKCDFLLLTGRPSKYPIIGSILLEGLPVLPNRLIFMHNYTVGDWYPFVETENKIGDPKTTVVVGALLCSMAENMLLKDFSIPTKSFSLPSTANFIGTMDPDGSVLKQIIFQRKPGDLFPDENREPMMYGQPTTLGLRQLPFSWWPANPLYALGTNIKNNNFQNILKNHPVPWKIQFEKIGNKDTEEFRITEITDNDGEDVSISALKLSLQTVHEKEGYWLDTGKIKLN